MTIIEKDELAEAMDFDHVIQVHDDGTISHPRNIFAPELIGNPDGRETLEGGWDLMTDGYTRQDGYHGPILHNSELISFSMADEILHNPGYYVSLVCYWPEDDDEGDTYAEGWAIAYRPA